MNEPNPVESPKRHGCFTAWLIVILFFSIFALPTIYILQSLPTPTTAPTDAPPKMTVGALTLLSIISALDLVAVIGLFKWKKWGAYLYLVVMVVGMVGSIITSTTMTQILSNIGTTISALLVAWLAMNIGGERKAWTRLT